MVTVAALVLSLSSCNFAPTESNTVQAQTLMQQIKQFEQKNDTDSLIKTANHYLVSHPTDKDILLALARGYYIKKEYSLAEQTIAKVLSLDPKNARAFRIAARVKRAQYETEENEGLKQKYLDMAVAAIEQSLTYAPDDSTTNGEAALIYFYKNDKGKAARFIEVARKGDPKAKYLITIQEQVKSMP
jgi:tetratricopeptide (TPR) repeat protein